MKAKLHCITHCQTLTHGALESAPVLPELAGLWENMSAIVTRTDVRNIPSHRNVAAVCAIAFSNCHGLSVTEGSALD